MRGLFLSGEHRGACQQWPAGRRRTVGAEPARTSRGRLPRSSEASGTRVSTTKRMGETTLEWLATSRKKDLSCSLEMVPVSSTNGSDLSEGRRSGRAEGAAG